MGERSTTIDILPSSTQSSPKEGCIGSHMRSPCHSSLTKMTSLSSVNFGGHFHDAFGDNDVDSMHEMSRSNNHLVRCYNYDYSDAANDLYTRSSASSISDSDSEISWSDNIDALNSLMAFTNGKSQLNEIDELKIIKVQKRSLSSDMSDVDIKTPEREMSVDAVEKPEEMTDFTTYLITDSVPDERKKSRWGLNEIRRRSMQMLHPKSSSDKNRRQSALMLHPKIRSEKIRTRSDQFLHPKNTPDKNRRQSTQMVVPINTPTSAVWSPITNLESEHYHVRMSDTICTDEVLAIPTANTALGNKKDLFKKIVGMTKWKDILTRSERHNAKLENHISVALPQEEMGALSDGNLLFTISPNLNYIPTINLNEGKLGVHTTIPSKTTSGQSSVKQAKFSQSSQNENSDFVKQAIYVPLTQIERKKLRRGRRKQKRLEVSYAMYLVPVLKDNTYDAKYLNIPLTKSDTIGELPKINNSLNFTKLRNLKIDIFGLVDKADYIDESTAAYAWVYFEKMVTKNLVTKSTRKLMAGVCLMLASKFNQEMTREMSRNLANQIQKLDRKESLSALDIFAAEFFVFQSLEFGLHVQPQALAPHIIQYLELQDKEYKDLCGLRNWALIGPEGASGDGLLNELPFI